MPDHDEIVIDIHRAGIRVNAPSDLMGVIGCGEPGTDINELGNPLTGSERYRALEELPVRPRGDGRIRRVLQKSFRRLAVGRVMSLPAEEIIVYPRRVGDRDIKVDHRVSFSVFCVASLDTRRLPTAAGNTG